MINLFYDNSIVNTDKGDDVEEGEEQEQEQVIGRFPRVQQSG